MGLLELLQAERKDHSLRQEVPSVKEKQLNLEILRILAIVLVIFNHTGTNGFSMFTENCGRASYWLTLILAIACKIAVPLFFMISGGLLLHKNDPVQVVLKKRVLRIAVVLLVFSVINYLLRIRWGMVESPSVHDFLAKLWHEGLTDPYWYLYTYLGFLLMLPFLRPMVQNMPDRAFGYLLVLNLLFVGILPTAGYLLKLDMINEDFWIPLVLKNGIYFLLGYYVMHRLDLAKVTGKRLTGLWAFAIGTLLLTAILMTLDKEQLWRYFERFTLWNTLAVYLTVTLIVRAHPITGWEAKLLSELGSCVFGTFLLEGILRYEYTGMFQYLRPRIHTLPACAVFILAVTITGFLITWLLRRIPLLRRFI